MVVICREHHLRAWQFAWSNIFASQPIDSHLVCGYCCSFTPIAREVT